MVGAEYLRRDTGGYHPAGIGVIPQPCPHAAKQRLRKSLPDCMAELDPWQQIGAALALRAETRRGGRRDRAGKPCDKRRRDGTKAQCGREQVYRKIVDEQPMDRAVG